MAEPVTAINGAQGTGTPPATRTRIHWGRVVKGVAAITAVAVVAVCGYWFASSFVTTLLAGNAGLASAAATTGNMAGSFFSTLSGWITGGLSAAGQYLGTFFTTLFPSLATATAAAPVDPTAFGSWVGKAVAGGTAFIAGVFALKNAAPILTADPSIMPTDQVTAYQATKTALKSAELAHHAAEHSGHHARHESPTQRNWVERSGIRHRPAASFAEKIAQEEATLPATTLKR